MDIYLPKETLAKSIPVILWWHSGGLMQGTRKAPTSLSPQTAIKFLSDCKAAVDFLHSPAFQAATNNRVDASKLVVSGSSAGGWLSLLVGNGIGYEACGLESPASRVRGIAAVYPITDLNDPFWMDKKEKTAYFERAVPQEEMAEYLDPKAPKVASSSLDSPRWLFSTYMVPLHPPYVVYP
ncbi:AB hydrolase superfamily protein [Pleurotus pulmonarius]